MTAKREERRGDDEEEKLVRTRLLRPVITAVWSPMDLRMERESGLCPQ